MCEVFDEFDLDFRPQSIYNMDETGVPLEPEPPKLSHSQKGAEEDTLATAPLSRKHR